MHWVWRTFWFVLCLVRPTYYIGLMDRISKLICLIIGQTEFHSMYSHNVMFPQLKKVSQHPSQGISTASSASTATIDFHCPAIPVSFRCYVTASQPVSPVCKTRLDLNVDVLLPSENSIYFQLSCSHFRYTLCAYNRTYTFNRIATYVLSKLKHTSKSTPSTRIYTNTFSHPLWGIKIRIYKKMVEHQ